MKLVAYIGAVLATAACTRYVSGPPPSTTTVAPPSTTMVAPTNTRTATQASPPTVSAPTTQPSVGLQPGPHSAIADIDLPAGTVPRSGPSEEEYWTYTAPYPDTVTFLQNQFATGRRYDTYGATWWNGLPPCYDDASPKHHSPPLGSDAGERLGGQPGDAHEWVWSDGAVTLFIRMYRPGADLRSGKADALIIIESWGGPAAQYGVTCNRA